MAGKSPQGQLTEMNPAKVKAIIHSLRELYDMGRPESNSELKERIDMFFEFCEESSIRPGVQALCTALHISRTTLFRWSNGEDCDQERQEIIVMAKSFLDSFFGASDTFRASKPASRDFLAKELVFIQGHDFFRGCKQHCTA